MIIFCIIFGVLSVILGFWVGAHANKISHLLYRLFRCCPW